MPEPPPPTVSAIIVNFRTPDLTKAAVESLLREPELGEVIVVDNGSGDESLSRLKPLESDARVRIVASDENLGFGGANNLGAREARYPLLFLLNSDATLHPGGLGPLVATMRDSMVGLAAPQVFLRDGRTPQPDAHGVFPTFSNILLRKNQPDPADLTPDWLSGVALMVRGDEFFDLGGFDERIFMYFEDVLLSYRFKQRGLRTQRVLEAGVTHLGGGSSRTEWTRKSQYYAAQDLVLKEMGTSAAGIAALRALRLPYRLLQSLKVHKSSG